MRLKITGQILGLLLVILPAMYISLLVLAILLFGRWSTMSGENGAIYTQASSITINFEQHLQWQAGKISVDSSEMDDLHKLGVWLQVLDENGTQIYQQYKPASAPTHYTPAELILNYKYSGAIKDDVQGYTLFVARSDRGERHFSYILGFPDTEVVKATIYANPRTFYLDLLKMAGGAVIIVTLVMALLAYVYGDHLAAPLANIIEGVQHLAYADYSHSLDEHGIYGTVNRSMNKLAQALQKNEKDRLQLQAAREDWIANISHDVKTPLASLRGYAELLADPDYNFSPEEVRKYAQIMQDKSIYMQGLVEDLQLTYQLKNASLPLKMEIVNLVSLLREVTINLLNDPRFGQATLHFAPARETIPFAGDPHLLQRAFTNLLLNALVHNPPGTPITVSVAADDQICVTIQDRGTGIPSEEVERLFEQYYRGTNTSETYQGSGLGMVISQQIILAHAGQINVYSQLGSGTKILVLLPAAA